MRSRYISKDFSRTLDVGRSILYEPESRDQGLSGTISGVIGTCLDREKTLKDYVVDLCVFALILPCFFLDFWLDGSREREIRLL